jgi:exopolysaccharide biosynthesis WecB/TagA/CpsF family protein
LYGSKQAVLDRFATNLQAKFAGLKIAGSEPSKFRRLEPAEKEAVVERIRASNADVVFVGLGCPRQEVWAYEYRDALSMPLLAVGAAFDFHAGTLPQAPRWMQDRGLEWVYRFYQEPKRLWQRYMILNPLFLFHIAKQMSGLNPATPAFPDAAIAMENYG